MRKEPEYKGIDKAVDGMIYAKNVATPPAEKAVHQ